MSALTFANNIINEIKTSIGESGENFDSTTPIKANIAISKGISDYIKNNTRISITYSGVTPTGVPVTLTDTCSVTGSCSIISGTNFISWVKSIESNIVSGFFISNGDIGVIPLSPTLIFLPGLSLTQNEIKKAHENNINDPQSSVWEVICQSIMNWIQLIIPPPYPASFPGSTGTAVINKIIIL